MSGGPAQEEGAWTGRTTGLLATTLSGLYWMFFGTAAQALLRIAAVVILARLLEPEEFGVVSAALVVIGFSTIIAQFGVGPAIVQRQSIEPRHLRTGFTLSILLATLMTGLLWLTASPIAHFFRIQGLTPVVRALSLIFLIQGSAVVAQSILQRELQFRRLVMIDVLAFGMGYGGVGVSLGFLGYGAWALVAAHLTQELMRSVILLAVRRHPVGPSLDGESLGDLLRFGGGFTVARMGNYIGGQGDYLVVGRWLGAEALGIYGRAYQLMSTPATLLGEILDKVLFPAMAKVQDRPERLEKAYRRGIVFIGMTVLPASVSLFILAPELVDLALGPRWADVVAPLRILAIGMLFRASYKMSDSIARATGAVYRRAWRQWVYAGLVTIGAYVGSFRGTEGVAAGVVAAIGVNFLLMAHLSLRLSGMTWPGFFMAHAPTVALATILGLEVGILGGVLRAWSDSSLLVLGVSAAAAVATATLLFRYLPGIVLGPDGRWILERLSESARGVFIGSRQRGGA